MAYLVLARKWRPKKFQDLIGQEHIARSLKNALDSERIGQSYLFVGTRGIGKTSVARIFAKALRCLQRDEDKNPCGECFECKAVDQDSSMDIIEIDGASNNGVDNIRQLVESAQYLPTSGKFKVYVIDEVHMLSIGAFNALLKTLEEPPPHVIFLFATTEPDRIPDTILSRCQRFNFKPVEAEVLYQHLKKIARVEEITFERDESVMQIAKMAQGSFRDALSLLEQILVYTSGKRVTDETLTFALGLISFDQVRLMTVDLLLQNSEGLKARTKELFSKQINLEYYLTSLLDHLFVLIDLIDDPVKFREAAGLDAKLIETISSAELFWIYETLSKDFEWALRSLAPKQVAAVALLKVAKRGEFFGKKKRVSRIIEADQVQTVHIVPEATPDLPVEVSTPTEFQSEELIKRIRTRSPVIASNLEQGNLLEQKKEELVWGFPQASKVFSDYLETKEATQKVESLIKSLYNLSYNLIFRVRLLTSEEQKSLGLFPLVEIERKKEEVTISRRREGLIDHPGIKEAEKLFNSKVEKIILNQEKKS